MVLNRSGLGTHIYHVIMSHSQPIFIQTKEIYVTRLFSMRLPILRQFITKAGHRKAILEWTPEAEEAFTRLKQSMYSAASLAAPDFKEPFYLRWEHTKRVTRVRRV